MLRVDTSTAGYGRFARFRLVARLLYILSMMKHAAIASVLIALTAIPAAAQGRGKSGKVPPGHMPPAGMCRVWYEGVPPGRQPRGAMSCAEAERVAARNGGARVIYGDGRTTRGQGAGGGVLDRDRDRDDRDGRDDRVGRDRRRPTGDNRQPRGRAIPRTERYPAGDAGRYPARRGDARLESAAAENGYRDGLVKGREDANDGDSFDPNRHAWYRSADRGYESRYGSRESYRTEYRRGFRQAYDQAYANGRSSGSRSRPSWWPF